MKKISVIRADFYSNGIVMPIGITYDDGETELISKVVDSNMSVNALGEREYKILCETKNKKLMLRFKDSVWEILCPPKNKM